MDIQIISLNMAGWVWKITNETWKARLNRTLNYIKSKAKDPFIIALQEVQLSGGVYLQDIRNVFPDYEIILPKAYAYKDDPKSVVAVMLINKKMYSSFSLMTLDGLEKSLRYNYVTVNARIGGEELCFRVLNVHVPHLCNANKAKWYQDERKAMREIFLKDIKEAAETYRAETDIKFICLGDLNTLPEDDFFQNMIYSHIDCPMFDAISDKDKCKATWDNTKAGGKGRLDYIFYSSGMLLDTVIGAKRTEVDDTTIIQKMSDHAILFGGLHLEITYKFLN